MSLRKAYYQLHIAVILLAGTAILGVVITQPPSILVWWRTLIAITGIALFLWWKKKLRWDWIRQQRKIYMLGALVGIHWILFFGSIKLANASIALICFATLTFFTAWIEPWITRRPLVRHEVILGLIVIPGIMLIAGKAEGDIIWGIVLGIAATVLVAVISSLEKKWISQIDPEHMTLMQMAGAWIFMCVWIIGEMVLGYRFALLPTGYDWLYLLILGIACTSVAWVLAARAITVVTAYDSSMVINLEPVYGICMALLILKEGKELNLNFYIGASIILSTVIVHPIWQRYHARQRNPPIRG